MALAAAPLGPRDEWANPALVAPKAALCWRRLIAGCSAALCLRVPGADLPFMGPLRGRPAPLEALTQDGTAALRAVG